MLTVALNAGKGNSMRKTDSHQRLKGALWSGFIAWLCGVLVAALFGSPLVAAHHDFNHYHPEGVPEHYHSIDSTLGSPVITAVVVITVLFAVVALLGPNRRPPVLPLRVRRASQARAPPLRPAAN